MTFIQMLGQNGAITTFVIWIVVSFLLGLFIGNSRGKAKAREAEKVVSSPAEFVPSRQQTQINNAGLIAAITAAVNEYRTNTIRTNNTF